MFQRATITLAIYLALCLAPTNAQQVNTHRGFWLSFGAGGGWMGDERSATTYFRMGGTPNEWVHFGGQVLHWWQHEDAEHTSVSAVFSVYPLLGARGGLGLFNEFFLKTGFGISAADCYEHDVSGLGLNFGTGIDLQIGGNFFVTPNIDYLVDFYSQSTYTSLLFSLGLSWH